jgi:hypothetical protein
VQPDAQAPFALIPNGASTFFVFVLLPPFIIYKHMNPKQHIFLNGGIGFVQVSML